MGNIFWWQQPWYTQPDSIVSAKCGAICRTQSPSTIMSIPCVSKLKFEEEFFDVPYPGDLVKRDLSFCFHSWVWQVFFMMTLPMESTCVAKPSFSPNDFTEFNHPCSFLMLWESHLNRRSDSILMLVRDRISHDKNYFANVIIENAW